MAAPLLAAGITSAASLAGGFIQSAGNKRAVNAAAQKNMEMYERQRADALADRQHQEDYDTAASQRQRLEAAGLNPYLMMDGGSAGSAASATTAQFGNAQPANYVSTLGDSVGRAVDVMRNRRMDDIAEHQANAQISKTESETAAQNIQNQYLAAQAEATLKRMGLDYKIASQGHAINLATQRAQLAGIGLDNRNKQIQNTLASLDVESKRIINKHLDAEHAIALATAKEQLQQMFVSKQLTKNELQRSNYELVNFITANNAVTQRERAQLAHQLYNKELAEAFADTNTAAGKLPWSLEGSQFFDITYPDKISRKIGNTSNFFEQVVRKALGTAGSFIRFGK